MVRRVAYEVGVIGLEALGLVTIFQLWENHTSQHQHIIVMLLVFNLIIPFLNIGNVLCSLSQTCHLVKRLNYTDDFRFENSLLFLCSRP